MNGGPGKARRLEQAKQVAYGFDVFVINRRTSFALLLSVVLGGSDASWAQSDPIPRGTVALQCEGDRRYLTVLRSRTVLSNTRLIVQIQRPPMKASG
jgi:hypothetical protein